MSGGQAVRLAHHIVLRSTSVSSNGHQVCHQHVNTPFKFQMPCSPLSTHHPRALPQKQVPAGPSSGRCLCSARPAPWTLGGPLLSQGMGPDQDMLMPGLPWESGLLLIAQKLEGSMQQKQLRPPHLVSWKTPFSTTKGKIRIAVHFLKWQFLSFFPLCYTPT